MKEMSFNFSLTDFLAYLFPGTITLVAIAAVIRLSPFGYLLYEIPQNIFTGLILVAIAYFVGTIISAVTYSIEEGLDKLFHKFFKVDVEPLSKFQLSDVFKEEALKVFNGIFGASGDWSSSHFFISRSLVREKMPNGVAGIERRGSLRLFRRNSLIPMLLLGFAGLMTCYLRYHQIEQPWFAGLLGVSSVGSILITIFLWKAEKRIRKREAREVCSMFLAFYYQSKMNLPSQPNNSFNRSAN